ncbi:MAG: hypothetical protein ACYDCB_05390 [Candidatus Dormibacteria bacterium]
MQTSEICAMDQSQHRTSAPPGCRARPGVPRLRNRSFVKLAGCPVLSAAERRRDFLPGSNHGARW